MSDHLAFASSLQARSEVFANLLLLALARCRTHGQKEIKLFAFDALA